MKKYPEISVIIIYYKEKKEIEKCLLSIENIKTKHSYEIIVVDNSPNTKLQKYLEKNFSKVNYIKAPTNLGYGKGINLAVKSAKGKYILPLNPDSTFDSNVIDDLADFMDAQNKEVVITPSLFETNKKIYHLGGSFYCRLLILFSLTTRFRSHIGQNLQDTIILIGLK